MVLAPECLHTVVDGDPHAKCAKCLQSNQQKICTPSNGCDLCKNLSPAIWSKILAARMKTDYKIPKLKTSPTTVSTLCFIILVMFDTNTPCPGMLVNLP